MRRSFKLALVPLLMLVAFVAADEPADYKELEKILPKTLIGMELTDSAGQKIDANGQKFTQAMGEYEMADGEADATINIVDYTAMPQVAAAMTAWKNMTFEQVSDEGYQKSTTIRDCPAMVSWETSGTGSVTLLVGENYLLQVTLSDITEAQFDAAMAELPIDALQNLGGGQSSTTAPAE